MPDFIKNQQSHSSKLNLEKTSVVNSGNDSCKTIVPAAKPNIAAKNINKNSATIFIIMRPCISGTPLKWDLFFTVAAWLLHGWLLYRRLLVILRLWIWLSLIWIGRLVLLIFLTANK